jgi:hypothetical protein
MSFEVTRLMTVARILVHINLWKGLYQELLIESVARDFVQTLDYKGIPFRCHRCHVYGHGVAKMSTILQGKRPDDKRDKLLHLSPTKEMGTIAGHRGQQKTGSADHWRYCSAGQGSGSGCNQGSGQEVLSVVGPLSSPSLDYLLHREHELMGMSTLDASLTTLESFTPLVFTESTSFTSGGKSLSCVSPASLHYPFSSSSSVFAPLRVTPSINLGELGTSLLTGLLTSTELSPTPVADAPPLQLFSPPLPPWKLCFLPLYPFTLDTPSASIDSSSEDNRVHYHLRSRS